MEDKTTDIQNEQYANEQSAKMQDEAGNCTHPELQGIKVGPITVESISKEAAEKWANEAERLLYESRIDMKPNVGYWNKIIASIDPVDISGRKPETNMERLISPELVEEIVKYYKGNYNEKVAEEITSTGVIYNSLEEIIQDIRRAGTIAVIWKLEATIKSGAYIQTDGRE